MTARPRSLPRRIGRIAAALVALFGLRIGLAHLLGPWVEARERAKLEALVGSLDPASFAEPPIPDRENAVTAVREVLAELDLESNSWPLLGHPAHSPTGVDLEQLDARLAAQSKALDRLADAIARPRSSFGPFPADRSALLHDEIGSWIRAGRLVWLDGSRALAHGDDARLRRDLAILSGFASILRRAPQVPGQLLGTAVERNYLDLLRAALESPIDRGLLDAATAQIAELRQLPGPLADFRRRGASLLDSLEHPEPRETGPELPPVPWIRRLGWALLPWSEEHEVGWHWVVELRLAELSLVPRARWPERLALGPTPAYRIRTWIDPTAPYNDWSPGIMVPNTITLIDKLQATAAVEQLAAVAVELAMRSRDGEPYPRTLERISDGTTPDAFGGEPIHYRLSADGTVELELRALRLEALDDLRGLTEPNPRRRLRDGVLERLRAATHLELDLVDSLVEADAEELLAISQPSFRQVYERRARLARWRLPERDHDPQPE